MEEKKSCSRVRRSSGTFSFTIDGYSGLSNRVGDSTESPEFDLCGHTWQLRIFPGGSLENHRGYLSFYLASKSTKSARAAYKLCIINRLPGGNDEIFASSGVRLFEAKGVQIDGWGRDKFMSAALLQNSNNAVIHGAVGNTNGNGNRNNTNITSNNNSSHNRSHHNSSSNTNNDNDAHTNHNDQQQGHGYCVDDTVIFKVEITVYGDLEPVPTSLHGNDVPVPSLAKCLRHLLESDNNIDNGENDSSNSSSSNDNGSDGERTYDIELICAHSNVDGDVTNSNNSINSNINSGIDGTSCNSFFNLSRSSSGKIIAAAPNTDASALQQLQHHHYHQSSSPYKLKAHRCILKARSPVFRAMLNVHMVESNTGIIMVPDVEYHVMRELLLFMYTDELCCDVKTMENIAESLFCAASKYQVQGMISICEDYLSAQINLENIIGLLQLSDVYTSKKLKQQCLHFISQNVLQIIQNKEYIQLKQQSQLKQQHLLNHANIHNLTHYDNNSINNSVAVSSKNTMRTSGNTMYINGVNSSNSDKTNISTATTTVTTTPSSSTTSSPRNININNSSTSTNNMFSSSTSANTNTNTTNIITPFITTAPTETFSAAAAIAATHTMNHDVHSDEGNEYDNNNNNKNIEDDGDEDDIMFLSLFKEVEAVVESALRRKGGSGRNGSGGSEGLSGSGNERRFGASCIIH